MKKVTSITAIMWMAMASATWAGQPPASITMVAPQINYQGRLVTVSNVPYADVLHTIDLALYPEASNTKLSNERFYVQTKDGYFSVNLGSGTSLGSYPPLWQVLWKTNAGDSDKFFMGLTVWTDQTGKTNSTAVEATPRQQFLSAPFAMRSLQSIYSSKSDGIFQAPQGVSTTTLISPTNNEVAVNANMRVQSVNNVFANNIIAHGASPKLDLLSSGGRITLGVAQGAGKVITNYASSIQIGTQPSSISEIPGTDVKIDGKSVDIGTTNLTVNSQPLFVKSSVQVNASTASPTTLIATDIDNTYYNVFVVGWYYNANAPNVKGVFMDSVSVNAWVNFDATPSGGSITIHFLGIRKGLVKFL